MAVDDVIDYTPEYSFSTLQFESEVVNLIITSLIAVFILSNIGSIISKFVYFTRETSFNYNSWLQAFIFANSDNPVRIITWIFRGYVYRQDLKRFPNKLRLQRLFVPLLARFTILFFSILSIAITLLSEKRISVCNESDYFLTLDPTKATFSNLPNSICLNIPLASTRGSVLASAAYCTCPLGEQVERSDSGVAVYRDEKEGRLRTILFSGGFAAGTASYVEWKRTDDEKYRTVISYRTDMSSNGNGASIDQEIHADIVIRALSASNEGCTRGVPEIGRNPEEGIYRYLVPLLGCDFDTEKEIDVVNSHLRNALTWVRTTDEPKRLVLEGTFSKTGNVTGVCPIEVSVQRPLVNIAPLVCGLLGIFLINILVSIFVNRHGNALDAGFHIIKEALGHDCTSNPLEQPVDRKEVNVVHLQNWICNGGGSYVGFTGRHCDRVVDKFEKDTTICSCVNTARELTDSIHGTGTEAGSTSDAFSSYGAFNGSHAYTGGAGVSGYNQFNPV